MVVDAFRNYITRYKIALLTMKHSLLKRYVYSFLVPKTLFLGKALWKVLPARPRN